MTAAPLKTRLAALAVLIALAGMAAFAVFGGPTKVPASGGSNAAPTQVVPSSGEPEDDGGGQFGD
jgi:hypothetical protein